jgi:hypothetical protein
MKRFMVLRVVTVFLSTCASVVVADCFNVLRYPCGGPTACSDYCVEDTYECLSPTIKERVSRRMREEDSP